MRKVARDLSAGPKNKDLRASDEKGYFHGGLHLRGQDAPQARQRLQRAAIQYYVRDGHDRTDKFHRHERLNEKFEMRPSFVSHAGGLEEPLFGTGLEGRLQDGRDEALGAVTPMPTIEYEYDGGKGDKALYVPKLRLTYYLYEEAIQPVIETVMPIIFAYVANYVQHHQLAQGRGARVQGLPGKQCRHRPHDRLHHPEYSQKRALDAVEVELRVCRVDLRVARLSLRRTWCDGRSPCSGSATAQT